jgi:hypothetical protein
MNTIEANFENDVIIVGPLCTYNGKFTPCFIRCSRNASITSQMLADMLEVLDSSHIFDHEDGSTPFFLLHGHHHWLNLPFLPYISGRFPIIHSLQMNRSFKIAVTKYKWELLASPTGKSYRFVQTDIIPLFQKSWYESFPKTISHKRQS